MEHADFYYKRKPAFVSFLLIYLLCSGISYLLIKHSAEISAHIVRMILRFRILLPYIHSYNFRALPYGIIIAFPFLVYGVGKLLWNIMTTYEITSSQIRLLAGTLRRKEQVIPLSGIYELSFTQTLPEVPFGIGTLVFQRGGARIEIKGVYGVKRVVDTIREIMKTPYH